MSNVTGRIGFQELLLHYQRRYRREYFIQLIGVLNSSLGVIYYVPFVWFKRNDYEQARRE